MKQPINESTLSDRDLKFLQLGRGSAIPGMQRAIDLLQEQLTLMKEEMYSLQILITQRDQAAPAAPAGEVAQLALPPALPKKRGRPRKAIVTPRAAASQGYWANMTAEERSIEMKRRQAKRGKKAKGKLHPRDKAHPDHAQWLGNLRKAVRKQWDAYSPAERKRRTRQMLKGRTNAAPTVRMMLEKTA